LRTLELFSIGTAHNQLTSATSHAGTSHPAARISRSNETGAIADNHSRRSTHTRPGQFSNRDIARRVPPDGTRATWLIASAGWRSRDESQTTRRPGTLSPSKTSFVLSIWGIFAGQRLRRRLSGRAQASPRDYFSVRLLFSSLRLLISSVTPLKQLATRNALIFNAPTNPTTPLLPNVARV
jgi:hypothetical protein